MSFLISVEDLADRLGQPNLRIVDASWHLDGRDARADFQQAHIPGAVFFDLDAVSDRDFALEFLSAAAISATGDIVPVLVSLWMSVSESNCPVASFASIASARMAEPHGTCSASASLPQRFATSSHLSENAPFMQLSTFFCVRLRSAPSITPHALEVER